MIILVLYDWQHKSNAINILIRLIKNRPKYLYVCYNLIYGELFD